MKMVTYKNNLITIKPSRHNLFWFELYINGILEGQERSEESALDYGKYIIEDAINCLSRINDSIISFNLGGTLKNDQINSLKLLTGYSDYSIIWSKFDQITIKEFLKQFN